MPLPGSARRDVAILASGGAASKDAFINY